MSSMITDLNDVLLGVLPDTEWQRHSYEAVLTNPAVLPEGPGFYLWGSSRSTGGKEYSVPRYVGTASRNLRSRIVDLQGSSTGPDGRYVPTTISIQKGTFPQGLIATEYHMEILKIVHQLWGDLASETYSITMWQRLEQLLTVIPNEVRFHRGFTKTEKPQADLRCKHAIDWALHGGGALRHLWVQVAHSIPEDINGAEQRLIRAVVEWNANEGLPNLLNAQHNTYVNNRNPAESDKMWATRLDAKGLAHRS